MYAARTRFIEASMLQFFTNITWPAATGPVDGKLQPHGEPVNIGMRQRGMWR
jgi:DNA helicase-2/ATP-dependent DNA helicase PcrA